MMRLRSSLVGFGRFWYRFIIGDDWTVAASVVLGLAATSLLNNGHFPAWLIIPLVVIVILRVNVHRSKHKTRHLGVEPRR